MVGGDANILADLTKHLVYLETKCNQLLCQGSRKRAISTIVAVERFLAVPSEEFHKTTASWTGSIPSSINYGADLKSPAVAGGIAHRLPQLGFRADVMFAARQLEAAPT
jgi:hypothetical protein